jgi:ethanolamine ammonia-lyase small subunit
MSPESIETIARIVREEIVRAQRVKGPCSTCADETCSGKCRPKDDEPRDRLRSESQVPRESTRSAARIVCAPVPRAAHEVEMPRDGKLLEALVAATSSQIATGRAGNRFKTDLFLRMREGHADAKDAVHSEIPDGWASARGWAELQSACKDRHEYLLHPNHGRRLNEASRAKVDALAKAQSRPPDVQVIMGDGLSPNALMKTGPACADALLPALQAAGYHTGSVLYTKFTRIGLADDIGARLKARATIILVGERPGLGTGDSLSFYIAVNPKLDQDNAEKNCISNVRPIGITPQEAAVLSVDILGRAFARGVGGVALGFGFQRQ